MQATSLSGREAGRHGITCPQNPSWLHPVDVRLPRGLSGVFPPSSSIGKSAMPSPIIDDVFHDCPSGLISAPLDPHVHALPLIKGSLSISAFAFSRSPFGRLVRKHHDRHVLVLFPAFLRHGRYAYPWSARIPDTRERTPGLSSALNLI